LEDMENSPCSDQASARGRQALWWKNIGW